MKKYFIADMSLGETFMLGTMEDKASRIVR